MPLTKKVIMIVLLGVSICLGRIAWINATAQQIEPLYHQLGEPFDINGQTVNAMITPASAKEKEMLFTKKLVEKKQYDDVFFKVEIKAPKLSKAGYAGYTLILNDYYRSSYIFASQTILSDGIIYYFHFSPDKFVEGCNKLVLSLPDDLMVDSTHYGFITEVEK